MQWLAYLITLDCSEVNIDRSDKSDGACGKIIKPIIFFSRIFVVVGGGGIFCKISQFFHNL